MTSGVDLVGTNRSQPGGPRAARRRPQQRARRQRIGSRLGLAALISVRVRLRRRDREVVAVELAGAAPAPVQRPETDELVDVDRPWDVLVWDDPVNLMSYVVFVFRRVFGFSDEVAQKLMLEVHERGKALVASEPREQAERYVKQLHGFGLHATMQRSS